jgi:serine protease Do
MTMRHGGWIGVLALMTGVTVSGGVKRMYAAQWSAASMASTGAFAAMSGGYGHGAQGYLGILFRDVGDDEVGSLKLKEARGAEIAALDHDGPACKAGMQMHDVILQMNGQIIDGEDQLRRMLRETLPGRTVSFVISRDGVTQTLTMQMANRKAVAIQAWEQHYTVPDPAPRPPVADYSVRGNTFMSAAPPSALTTPKGHRDFLGTNMILSSSFTGAQLEVMGPQLAQFFGADGGAGLLVRSVAGNSPAELAGMKAGDVVVRVNSIPVTSGADWTKTVHDNRGRQVPVVVLRDKHEETLTLTPDGKKRSSVKPLLPLPGGPQVSQVEWPQSMMS